MKRLIALLCILITLMSAIATANAASYDGEDSASLTAQEISVLQEKLIAYGYGTDNFASDTLYDPDGCPTFMLGITDAGYIILERDSLKFRECGGGNPYRDYG